MARYQRDSDWDAELAGGILGVAIMLVVIAAVALVTLLVATLVELGKVYRAHAGAGSPIARWFWLALAALAGIWLLAVLLAAAGVIAPAAYLAAWGFLVYVITVELLAHSQGEPSPSPLPDLGIEQVLEPWHVSATLGTYGNPANERLAA